MRDAHFKPGFEINETGERRGRREGREKGESGIDSYSAVRSQDHCGNYLNSCSEGQACVVPQVTQNAADVGCHVQRPNMT